MMHIFSGKNKTKGKRIVAIESVPYLYIPIPHYMRDFSVPIVNVGDKVCKFQLIAESKGVFSSNVHSPVSGIVEAIEEHPSADGTFVNTIVIKNDFEEKVEVRPTSLLDVQALTSEQLLNIIRGSGVVGEGGAQFPTAVKYTLDGKKINTFIVNGAECEPYLTADYALMSQRTKELLEGIAIINRILGAQEIVISIEEQNKQLQKVFEPFLNNPLYKNIRIVTLSNDYPQGAELQLIKSVIGLELPRNVLPRDAGVIVSNVGTIYAIYKAVVFHEPVVNRVITVAGNGCEGGNYEVKIGTPISYILDVLGISAENNTVVVGGPMMGRSVTDSNISVTKGTSGIILTKKEKIKRENCISCGYCVEVCPMGLMPMKFEEYYRKGKYFNLEKYSISSCIECAACEYICPANVALIESIKKGKIKLKQQADAIR